MESKELISSWLKEASELQQLQERKKEMKEECNKHVHRIQYYVESLYPGVGIEYKNENVFRRFFKEGYYYFRKKFDHNLDQLKKQLDEEEFHAYNSKTCLAVLRKRFETFLSQEPWQTYSGYHNEYEDDVKHFQVYTRYEILVLKNRIIYCLDGIENGIDARSHHEKESREKERAIRERGENERMMQTQEGEPNIVDVGLIVNDSSGTK
ncbi:hypothetical protein Tco_0577742 [Tanacetum coccineum]